MSFELHLDLSFMQELGGLCFVQLVHSKLRHFHVPAGSPGALVNLLHSGQILDETLQQERVVFEVRLVSSYTAFAQKT